MVMKINSKIINFSFVGFIFIYIIFSLFNQTVIQYSGGLGWDGASYHQVYEYFRGEPVQYNQITSPFNQRVLLPLIASFFNYDKFYIFKIINLICFFCGSFILLYKWKFSTIPLMFLFYLILTPQIPFRLTLFYPFNIDGVMYLYYSLIILFFGKPIKVFYLSLVFTPFKESALLIGIIYFVSLIIYNILSQKVFSYKYNKKIILMLFFLIVSLILYPKIIRLFLQGAETFQNPLDTILGWIRRYLLDYKYYVKILGALAIVFGGFLYYYFKNSNWLNHQLFFIVILTPILIFSGSDTTRILCISLPFVLDGIIKTCTTKKDLLWIAISFFCICAIKFPLMNLTFTNEMKIGEGFFITQPEYMPLRYSLVYITTALAAIIIPNYITKKYQRIIQSSSLQKQ